MYLIRLSNEACNIIQKASLYIFTNKCAKQDNKKRMSLHTNGYKI